MTSLKSEFEDWNTTSPGNTTVWHYDYDLPVLKQSVHMTVIYSIAYSAVFLCALFGNVLVVTVVYRNASMHTVTNYFIVNLAVADILVAIFVVPITLLSNLYTGWQFGPVMCKVTPYLQGVSVCASVNTLAAIAVDRYLAICQTLRCKLRSKTVKVVILCIWISSLVLIVPWAIYYVEDIYHNIHVCYQSWPSLMARKAYFLTAIFLCCYSIPLTLITVCYVLIALRVWRREMPGAKNASARIIHRSKVKVLKMLAVVVVMFAFSWMPLYIVNFCMEFSEACSNGPFIDMIAVPFSQWLGSSNSGMNPIIYCFFSKKFRNGFRDVITCVQFHRRANRFMSTRSLQNLQQNGCGKENNRKDLLAPSPEKTCSDSFV